MTPLTDRTPYWPPRFGPLFTRKTCLLCKRVRTMPYSCRLCAECKGRVHIRRLRREAAIAKK